MVFLCNLAMLALFPAGLMVGPLGDHVGLIGSLALLLALARYKSDRLPLLNRSSAQPQPQTATARSI